ncbi:hypothetical protein JZ785_03600 [Alicyclobacillus curvatus]|nr:hypothetical protein JZ785_03600 [Alicyclobacillus curvatus]
MNPYFAGGGASDIHSVSESALNTLESRLLVAGGGGGAGSSCVESGTLIRASPPIQQVCRKSPSRLPSQSS